MRAAKVQMSVRILAVWSGHSLFVDLYYNIFEFCKWATETLISLRKCAGWSWPTLATKYIRALFVLCASNQIFSSWTKQLFMTWKIPTDWRKGLDWYYDWSLYERTDRVSITWGICSIWCSQHHSPYFLMSDKFDEFDVVAVYRDLTGKML